MREFESLEKMEKYIRDNYLRETRGKILNFITHAFEFGEFKGYDEGEIDGYKDCLKENVHRGDNDDRLEEEFMRGYERGNEEGGEEGFAEGKDEGYEIGLKEGMDQGHEAGHNEGYEAGHDTGIEIGYEEGYEAGMNDASS